MVNQQTAGNLLSWSSLPSCWPKRLTAPCQDIFKRMATALMIPQLLWVTVLLSGCAGAGGLAAYSRPDIYKKIDQTEISRIKEGETTRAEVEQMLGQPMWGTMNPLTHEITLSYMGDWHADQPTGEKIIGFLFPVPSMLMPQHYTNEYQNVLITIDADGKVTKVSRQLRQQTSEGALFQYEILGNKIDFTKVALINEGETTTVELENLLGVPQLITDESNEVTWTYEWNRRNGEHNQHENVTVTIDPQGKVKKLTKDSWRGATWSHGNSSAPLDLNNLLKIQVGKTTREEVERLLGQPQWESVMEREAMTQTSLFYHRQSKKERFRCSEQVTIMLDANGVVESIK